MTTESKTDDAFLLDLLRRVAKVEGFPGDAKIDVKAQPNSGDGFVGFYSTAEIQGKNKVLKLFAKAASGSEKLRSRMCADLLFGREIYFYETVYPSILKFQSDRNVKRPFRSVCKCFLTFAESPHETLIFENLKEQGYVQFNKKLEMNDLTILFVYKLYAQLHAVSFAMKDQEPELYAKLCENLKDVIGTFFKKSGVDSAFSHYSEEVKQFFDPIKDAHVWSRTRNLTETLTTFFSKLGDAVDHSVIIHGDCWFNNFLFRYKDSSDQNTLEDIKILDWQVAFVNSPVLDLSYFFYAVATKTTMAQLNFFLKTYHDTLSESIREMGSDPEKLYPYSVFRDQWKQFSKFGLFLCFAVQRLLLTENCEAPNPNDSVEAGGDWGDAFTSGLTKNEAYERRMREIIEHFVQNDFI